VIRKIHIGVFGMSRGWERLLTQIGLSWSRLYSVQALSVLEQSCVLLCKTPDVQEHQQLTAYLTAGGAILDTTGQLSTWSPVERNVNRVEPTSPAFQHIASIHIGTRALAHPTCSDLGGLAWFDPDPGRAYAFAGLPVDHLTTFGRQTHTEFRSSGLPPVAERTATRSSQPYIDAVLSFFKILHHKTGVPLVHKWWMPNTDKGAATFRIDTDYSSKPAIEATSGPVIEHEIPATWFLHVQAHEGWLEYFKTLPRQEVALHGYRHYEHTSVDQYYADISMALGLLSKVNIHPAGYAAPYGFWSRDLAEVLSRFNFDYSSEFMYDYDSLPSWPPVSNTLQLPVHPISIGSFSRFRFTSQMIRQYYREWIQLKMLQRMPIHLYHHPNDHHETELDAIFRTLRHDSTSWMTYREWAAWWKKRSSQSFSASYDTVQKSVHFSGNSTVPMAIHAEENLFLLTHKQKIDMEEGPWAPYIESTLPELIQKRRTASSFSAVERKKDELMTRLWRNRS